MRGLIVQHQEDKSMGVGKRLSVAFQWIVSISIALLGLLLIFAAPVGGLLMLLSSAVLMPSIAEKLAKLPGRKWLFPVLLISGFIMFGLSMHEDSVKHEETRLAQVTAEHVENTRQAELKKIAEHEAKRNQFVEQRDVIVSELKSLMDTENYQEIVDKGSMYTDFDKEVYLLVSKAKEVLAEHMEAVRLDREAEKREAQIQKILSEIDALPEMDTQGHLMRYKQLVYLSPDNAGYKKKLERFQNIAEAERQNRKAEEQKNRALQASQKKWNLLTSKSALDDSVNVYMHVSSNNHILGTLNQPVRPKLWVRCSENTTSAYIDWDVYINIQDSPMTYRIDSQNASTRSFTISTDHKALGYFSGGQSIPFVKSLFGATKLLIQVTPYGKNTAQVTFDVSGIEQAIAPLRKACNW